MLPGKVRYELPNLDCLRAFAVSCVLINHIVTMLRTRHGLPDLPFASALGRTGVLAFFVHTSLVLMQSLERTPPQGRTLNFYVRRAFRIYPLAMLGVVASVVFQIPVAPMASLNVLETTPARIVANLLLVQNLFTKVSLSVPMWSLPYEVQMYIVLPALFVVAQRRRGLLAWLIAIFSVIGWLVQYATGHANLLGFIPCFLAGVTAYTLRGTVARFPAWAWPIFVAGWMLLTAAANTYPPLISFPATWAACVILAVSIYRFAESSWHGWNTLMAAIARYSYGMYLTHVPMLWVVFWVLNIRNNTLAALLWLALTLGVSILLYYTVEAPMIKLGHRVGSALTRPRPKMMAAASETPAS